MKVYSLLLLFSVLFLFAHCDEKLRPELPKKYSANFIERALVIDGHLNENEWKDALWSDYFLDIEGEKKPTPFLETRMKMLWDKHYLYIAAEMEEPHLWATLTDKDAIIYRDNDFEVFIDPDGDGLNYYELEINALGTILDLFMEKPYNQKGSANLPWDFKGLKSAVSLKGTLNNSDDADSSWIVELAFPWTSFSANISESPKNGDEWRINFSRVHWNLDTESGDYRKKEGPEYNWVWSPQGKINMHIPEQWGNVKFEGRPQNENPETPRFWIWTGADKQKTTEDWDSTFRVLKDIGITGILMSSDTVVIKKVIPIADRLGMQVHAWFWTMNRGEADPDWLSYNQLGKSLAEERAYVDYYKFMCPAIPEVKDFIVSKMKELTDVEGLKGIHMDYIRYVDVILPKGLWSKYDLIQDHIMPEYDYGYHPYMKGLFNKKYGFSPDEIENISHDSLWLEFRLDELNKTVIGLRDYVNSTDLSITAAVFPTPDMSREMVRQDWEKWGLDYYFPMVYHNFYNEDIDWIKEVMLENKSIIPDYSKVFCGLFIPALKNENELTEAMMAAFDGGADGIAFFDLNALTELQKEEIKKLNQTLDGQ